MLRRSRLSSNGTVFGVRPPIPEGQACLRFEAKTTLGDGLREVIVSTGRRWVFESKVDLEPGQVIDLVVSPVPFLADIFPPRLAYAETRDRCAGVRRRRDDLRDRSDRVTASRNSLSTPHTYLLFVVLLAASICRFVWGIRRRSFSRAPETLRVGSRPCGGLGLGVAEWVVVGVVADEALVGVVAGRWDPPGLAVDEVDDPPPFLKNMMVECA
jgi:hypothetical protein